MNRHSKIEPQYNKRAARSRYMPHQGEREMERRRIGGFAFQRRIARWHKEMAEAVQA